MEDYWVHCSRSAGTLGRVMAVVGAGRLVVVHLHGQPRRRPAAEVPRRHRRLLRRSSKLHSRRVLLRVPQAQASWQGDGGNEREEEEEAGQHEEREEGLPCVARHFARARSRE